MGHGDFYLISDAGGTDMQQRLQKLIAAAGIASRRHAEELITAGKVTVNGKVVAALGAKADPKTDHIKVNGRRINARLHAQEKVYVLLNKPKGYLSSLSDPKDRPLVTDLVPTSLGRLHPVGRLDFNTEGLILLTNDGELTNHVTSARNRIAKVYKVKVKGVPAEYAIQRLCRGINLDDEKRTAPAEIERLEETKTNAWFAVTLHEGRNQQIRRMFDAIGHSVLKLARVRIGPIGDSKLKSGEWRFLTPLEVKKLYRGDIARKSKPARVAPHLSSLRYSAETSMRSAVRNKSSNRRGSQRKAQRMRRP
jgi:23S rRNA pseudouridine2605 synthase